MGQILSSLTFVAAFVAGLMFGIQTGLFWMLAAIWMILMSACFLLVDIRKELRKG